MSETEDCLFCKIASREIQSSKIYEDDEVLAFNDISPVAPVHFLVIPKEHIGSCAEIDKDNSAIVAHIFEVISLLAKQLELDEGFRVVSNCGVKAGQSVMHLHFHVMAKRTFEWPAG